MRKIIIASHHKMASGLKNTIEFIAGEQPTLTAIDAYMDNKPLDNLLEPLFSEKKDEDEVIIFTDLKAGSVNQGFIKYVSQPHVHLLTGMSLPLILPIVLSPSDAYLDDETIQGYIDDARQEIVYMNTELMKVITDDDDE